MHLTNEQYETEREAFRYAVLSALDGQARKTCAKLSGHVPQPMPGADDCDLPALFRTLDAQFERVMTRHGYTWDVDLVGGPARDVMGKVIADTTRTLEHHGRQQVGFGIAQPCPATGRPVDLLAGNIQVTGE